MFNKDETMQKHINLVGALHIGLGIAGVLGACFLFVIMLAPGILVNVIADEGIPLLVLSTIGTLLSLFILLTSIPGIIGGIALVKGKTWARIFVLVLSVLILFNIPIGTAIGAYSIWVLSQNEDQIVG
jgi:hypothetical protein